MEVSYTITPSDRRRLAEYLWHRGNRIKKFISKVFWCLLVAGFLWFCLGEQIKDLLLYHRTPDLLLPGLLVFLVVIIFLKQREDWLLGKKSGANNFDESIRVTQRNFVHEVNGQETAVNWSEVAAFDEDKHTFYILTNPELGDLDPSASGMQKSHHYVIPKRAFGTPAEANAFLEAARSFWQDGARSEAYEPKAMPDVSFKLTLEDMLYFGGYSTRKKKPWQFWGSRLYIVGMAALTGVLVWQSVQLAGPIHNPGVLISMGIPVAVMVMNLGIIVWLIRPGGPNRARFLASPNMIDHAGVSITPHGVSRMTARDQRDRKWAMITDIAIDARLIYFFTKKAQGFYVPLKAFASPSIAQAFYERAVRYWKGEGEADADAAIQDQASWPPAPRL